MKPHNEPREASWTYSGDVYNHDGDSYSFKATVNYSVVDGREDVDDVEITEQSWDDEHPLNHTFIAQAKRKATEAWLHRTL